MRALVLLSLSFIVVLSAAGCSGDPHRKILLSERNVYTAQPGKGGSLNLYLDNETRDFIIDVHGAGLRTGARYTIYAGKALEANAPLSLEKIADNVSVVKTSGAPGTVVKINFGMKTGLVPGKANFSESEVTIELVCSILRGGKKVWGTTIVKTARKGSALGYCSPLLIIRKQIMESYDRAIAEAGSESLKQALDELNGEILKSGVKF